MLLVKAYLVLLCGWLSEDSVKSVSTKPIVHKIDSVRKGTIPVYDYQLLESATNKFSDSNVLSRGGRGCLYRACLDEKSCVTVKKLDGCGETDIDKQFEVLLIHKRVHRIQPSHSINHNSAVLLNFSMQNEVDWLAKIRHQNIISLLGFCVYRQTSCIVYEMMQNGSLESQLHGM